MNRFIPFLAGLVLLLPACTEPSSKQPKADHLTDFVDPFIGTASHGHTYPGAAYPFGQIQLSPDNGTQGWDWCSGYNYSDSTLAGFSHLHLSGTGIGDLADISFLPVTSEVIFNKEESNADFVSRYAGRYSHDQEEASAGYYTVTLKNNDVRAEFTVTERAGLHRYSFPEGGEKNIITGTNPTKPH
jgi:putative alpha-1,2-mannosidase